MPRGAARGPGGRPVAGTHARAASPRRARGLRAQRRRAPPPGRARHHRPALGRRRGVRARARRRCWRSPGPARRRVRPAPAPRPLPARARPRRWRDRHLGRRRAFRRRLAACGACRASAASLEGPAAIEMARVRADLELGRADRRGAGAAPGRGRARLGSTRSAPRWRLQQLAGGDLAGLLRRFAAAAAERDRTAADARSATAQARFTGLLVAAMPAGTAVFAELLEPGFVGGLLAEPASAALLALAAALQLAGFVAIAAAQPSREPRVTPALVAASVLLAFAVGLAARRRAGRGDSSGRSPGGGAPDRGQGPFARRGGAGVGRLRAHRTRAGSSGRLGPAAVLAGKGAGDAARAGVRRDGRSGAARPAGGVGDRRAGAGGVPRRPTRCSSAPPGCRALRLVAALPDALDLLAVGAAAGRAPGGGDGGDRRSGRRGARP